MTHAPRTSYLPPDHHVFDPVFAHLTPRFRGLHLAGDAALLARRPRVGIVGSRAPRTDAGELARRIATDAARAGLVVVSGLARGIDSIAHQATLDADGATIAVLAGGLGRVQPVANRELAQRILGLETTRPHPDGVAAGHRPDAPGLLVSEYGAGAEESFPYRFRERNRIIAALSDYLVVIQARHDSGSMITADCALQLGIQVGVLPSMPDDPCHTGTVSLISDGADAVVDGASLLRRMELHGAVPPGFADAAATGARIDPTDPRGFSGGGAADQLALDEHPILQQLHVPRTADELAAAIGTDLADVRLQLLDLEDDGRAALRDDGAWQRT